jgi:site-specific recombinase XerD
MTEDMQVRNLALNTQTSYVQQVSLFARHFDKSPEQLGSEDIRAYQVYLTNEKKLAPGSVLIAVAALRFLYKVSLKKNWSFARHFVALSTYMGHADIASTYWYLEATPELMADIATAAESVATGEGL